VQVCPLTRSTSLAILFASMALVGEGAFSRCQAGELAPLRADRPPRFTAELAIPLDSLGRPTLRVSISVPHTDLEWIKTPNGYAGGAEFTVVIEPKRDGPNYGDAWDRRMVLASFEATTSPRLAMVERKVISVPPGKYQMRVQVRDINSGESSSATESIEIPDYSRVPVGFTDLELGTVDSSGSFQPSPTRAFGLNVSRLAVRLALFDRRPGAWPRSYSFRYRILDETGAELIVGRRTLSLSRSPDAVVLRPDSSDLFVGAYTFGVELSEGKSNWRVDRSFEVDESGPPRGKDFERLLEPLALIAESREIDALRALTPDEQTKGWAEFWQRRDPTPGTPRNENMLEFFRRLRYVDQHFQNFGPGWRSDMGRIYIKHGSPDQTEVRPATSDGPQVEIWYYNRPYRRFVFVDREGFGRYVLVNPSLE